MPTALSALTRSHIRLPLHRLTSFTCLCTFIHQESPIGVLKRPFLSSFEQNQRHSAIWGPATRTPFGGVCV
ncbi:hypothetical protein K437DRAFT_255992 [Tilletiaria anomala UBC 951]|uniref:Uncharacterized protein n=1 Tax=Tilletiaria anomala (strain ATCC 24038 / CBS 436.72 / UBC 951) TaxID=1037660 RepID=A0A066W7B4_TILAU|nr:uncharacterized protein K437DRAFT_255992 [Tilletiaria anomala UBC 951]KDN46974.1 hypothetical protein K437DRAFT_255992 [Tilletiaria anomala UBC 951]